MTRLNEVAYTEKKYFDRREWYEHVGMFAVGGAAGFGVDQYFPGYSEELGNRYKMAIGAGIYAAEWTASSWIKNRAYARYHNYPLGGLYTGRSQTAKGWILGGKWYEQSWFLGFGR